MAHTNTEWFTQYWRSLRNGPLAPARGQIDPGKFPRLAPFAVVLGREARGVYPIRLIGERAKALFARDLRGENALLLWRAKDALALTGALEFAARHPQALVLELAGRLASGGQVQLECMLAPLAGPSGEVDRFLGLFQLLSPAASLSQDSLIGLEITDLAADGAPPALRLAAAYGQAV